MKLNTRKSKKINKKKRLSRKKNKTRQVSKRLKNMRKKTQRGGSQSNNTVKPDRCTQLLSYINNEKPKYLDSDKHYEDSNENPYVLSNLIAAIVSNCSKRKKLDIKPLILLDKDITGSKYTAKIKDKLDNLIIAIAIWLKNQKPGNEDTENDNNEQCGDGKSIPHYNEIVHNLKTQWFSFNNVNIETSEIKNEFKEVIEYLFNYKSTPNNYQELKDKPDENNIKCIFIKIYGKILLDEFYSLSRGQNKYEDINWHKGPKRAQSAGANNNNNNLKSKGRIMGFGYKIAQNMLYGKLPGQEEKIDSSYDLWFNEIDTNIGLLNELNNKSIIKQAYEKIHGTQTVNNSNTEEEVV